MLRLFPNGQIIVDVTKEIKPDTLHTMTKIIQNELGEAGKRSKLVHLFGPKHTEEVALDRPTTIVSACGGLSVAKHIQDIFMNTCMRV